MSCAVTKNQVRLCKRLHRPLAEQLVAKMHTIALGNDLCRFFHQHVVAHKLRVGNRVGCESDLLGDLELWPVDQSAAAAGSG